MGRGPQSHNPELPAYISSPSSRPFPIGLYPVGDGTKAIRRPAAPNGTSSSFEIQIATESARLLQQSGQTSRLSRSSRAHLESLAGIAGLVLPVRAVQQSDAVLAEIWRVFGPAAASR